MTGVNRNRITKWFITFPHSGDLTPSGFIWKLFTECGVLSVAGVKETHEDGITPHLHINVHLVNKYGLSKSNMLLKIKRLFPDDYKRIDIKPTRQSVEKAKQGYLSKEGDVYYWNNTQLISDKKREKYIYDFKKVYHRCKMYCVDLEATLHETNWDNILGRPKRIVMFENWNFDTETQE